MDFHKVLGAELHLGYLGTWGLVAVLSMPALVLASRVHVSQKGDVAKRCLSYHRL